MRHLRQVGGLEVRLLRGHLADLGRHHLEVVDAVGRHLAVGRAEELEDLVDVPLHVRHRLAALVEAAADHHQPLHQLGPLHRDQHRHERPVAVPDQVGGLADDGVEEGDRVVGHQLVGDRPVDVRRVAVAAAFRCVDVEALGQRRRDWARRTARPPARRASAPAGRPSPCSSYHVFTVAQLHVRHRSAPGVLEVLDEALTGPPAETHRRPAARR